MDPVDHLAALRGDAEALLSAARDAEPDAPVACCPGWTVADLVWHIGEVHHFWGAVVAERLTDPEDYVEPDRPAGTDPDDPAGVFAFAAAAGDRLVDALATTDAATPVWTWAEQRDVAFVARRMAHETAVHRWDAEQAAGRDHDIDPPLASDGVDEFLEHFIHRVVDGAPPLDGSVHLHCTDVAGEWLVATAADGGYAVTREHAKGSAAMRGRATDLLLVLWRRRPLGAVDVVGEAAVAERFVTRTDLG